MVDVTSLLTPTGSVVLCSLVISVYSTGSENPGSSLIAEAFSHVNMPSPCKHAMSKSFYGNRRPGTWLRFLASKWRSHKHRTGKQGANPSGYDETLFDVGGALGHPTARRGVVYVSDIHIN